MMILERRALLGAAGASALSLALPRGARAEVASTLAGAGKSDIENYLRLQDAALRDNATAAALRSLNTAPRRPVDAADRLLMWHEISLDSNALDYVRPTDSTVAFHIEFGPHRSSRATALVQLVVFEVVNAVRQDYVSYAGLPAAEADALSLDAAIAQGAHDALVHEYPPQTARLDAILASDLATITDSTPRIAAGRRLGSQALAAVLARLGADNTQLPEPSIPADYQPSHAYGEWDVDPVSRIMVALGANWPQVTPFTFTRQSQFRPPPPPRAGSPAYQAALYMTQILGGDPLQGTRTARGPIETFMGKFWSYDGTPGLCAPSRLYNQIARQLAIAEGITQVSRLARFLAIVNVAMADAAVAAWESKYHYKYWRPITGIRWPGARGGDPNWYPLGAQATNTKGPNLTPPFPSYPSGHATFGGALFQVLRSYMPDDTPFTFVSDEFNGKNTDVYGYVRPREPARFQSLTDAEYSNAQSRIWIGVHWQFDADQGIAQGRRVADHVLATFAPPTGG